MMEKNIWNDEMMENKGEKAMEKRAWDDVKMNEECSTFSVGGKMMKQDVEMTFETEDCFSLARTIPHCAVILVLDTSHSMWGKGLRDMTQSLQVFCKTIERENFQNSQIEIAAVSMGDNLGMLEEFTAFDKSSLRSLVIRPKGDTPIGAALTLAMDKIEAQRKWYSQKGYSYVTPQLVLLSDGKDSADDFTGIAQEIRRKCAEGQLYCRAIAMGNSPDYDSLRKIAGESIITPLYGDLRNAFAEVGKVVSQTYESEAKEIVSEEVGTSRSQGVEVIDVETVSSGESEFLLDGSNIMHWGKACNGISLKYVLAITDELERQGKKYHVFFDATARHVLQKVSPAEHARFEKLLKKKAEHFHEVPAGTCADEFLLLSAKDKPNCRIITNDLYRDHKDKYPWVKEKSRLLHGMVVGDMLCIPDILMQISLENTENSAMNSL